MKTFLHSPISPSRCPRKVFTARDELGTILEGSQEPGQMMPRLYKLLKSLFPIDYILLDNPSPHRPSMPVHMYPSPGGNGVTLTKSMTEEQLQVVLESETPMVMRMGNQDDYTITTRIVREHFPEMQYSFLLFRYAIGKRYTGVLTLISSKPRAFTETHAAWLFILREQLTTYWTARSLSLTPVETSPQGPQMPLSKLPGMHQVMRMVWKVSRQECPVLLLGETGTGKEMVANTLYMGSARHRAPFIKINCGSIPESLIESELFGHEKGAFTHAVHTMKGRFERADRGVLLLDEVGELPLSAQTKLLRVLQERVIERVGGEREIHVDVRIIAATHQNLNQLTRRGQFRKDLFYRLNVFPIPIPPLRERPEDIPLLLNYFIYRKCVEQGIIELPVLSKTRMRQLCAYAWPGNIRELQNAVERAIILWDGKGSRNFSIELMDDVEPLETELPQLNTGGKILGSSAGQEWKGEDKPDWEKHPPLPDKGKKAAQEDLSLDQAMREHIWRVLHRTNGKISGKNGAAELLRLKPTTLRAKMQKLGILDNSRKEW